MKAGAGLRASSGKGRWLGADMAGVLGPGGRGRQSDGLSTQLPAQNRGLDGVTGRPQERTLVGKRPWWGPQGSAEASAPQAVRLVVGTQALTSWHPQRPRAGFSSSGPCSTAEVAGDGTGQRQSRAGPSTPVAVNTLSSDAP